jgi:micrococcal nuclease
MSARQKKLLLLLATVISAVIVRLASAPENSAEKIPLSPLSKEVATSSVGYTSSTVQVGTFIRVVDGDTIHVAINGKEESVRYIGINAPEITHPGRKSNQCFGEEAQKENEALLRGKEIKLIKEVSDRDRYGRLLRDVYVTQGTSSEVFVGYALVRSGFAKADVYPPDTWNAGILKEAQARAKEQGLGLWIACPH